MSSAACGEGAAPSPVPTPKGDGHHGPLYGEMHGNEPGSVYLWTPCPPPGTPLRSHP
jgi:hypothetical protein